MDAVLLQRLREAGAAAAPGVTDDQLAELEAVLGASLPDDVRALYRDHDGEPDDLDLPLRLMSCAEAAQANTALALERITERGVQLYWEAPGEAVYAGVHVREPLVPRVCLVDLHEIDLSPAWRSVESLVHAVVRGHAADASWDELATDYPATQPVTNARAAGSDATAVAALQPLYEAATVERDRRYYAHAIMALIPFGQTDTLLAFLDDPDMCSQERACEILGRRRWRTAVGRLVELARGGPPNTRIAAVVALGRIFTPNAVQHLRELREEMPDHRIYIDAAILGTYAEQPPPGMGR